MEKGYNGYTNYETWNVCLWVSNEESLYKWMRETKRSLGEFSPEEAENFVREVYPNGTPDMESRELSMDEVDWQEVAEVFNEE